MQGAIAEGDIRAAAKEFLELNDGALKAGRALGGNTEEIVNFIDGVGRTNPHIDALIARYNSLDAEIDKVGGSTNTLGVALAEEKQALGEQLDPLLKAQAAHAANTNAYSDEETAIRDTAEALSDHTEGMGTSLKATELVNKAIADSIDQHRRAARATDDSTDSQDDFARKLDESERKTRALSSALEAMRGQLDTEQALLTFSSNFQAAIDKAATGTALTSQDILDLKGDLLDVATYADLNPVQVRALMGQVDQGNIQGVLNLTQAQLDKAENAVVIRSKLDRPGQIVAGGSGGGGAGPTIASASVPEIGTLNMHLPAGWRGDPLRLAHAQRRRTGRLFSR
jgi:uncharacterized protein YdcH (DUF465 family)